MNIRNFFPIFFIFFLISSCASLLHPQPKKYSFQGKIILCHTVEPQANGSFNFYNCADGYTYQQIRDVKIFNDELTKWVDFRIN